jgi:hypothetical protein
MAIVNSPSEVWSLLSSGCIREDPSFFLDGILVVVQL